MHKQTAKHGIKKRSEVNLFNGLEVRTEITEFEYHEQSPGIVRHWPRWLRFRSQDCTGSYSEGPTCCSTAPFTEEGGKDRRVLVSQENKQQSSCDKVESPVMSLKTDLRVSVVLWGDCRAYELKMPRVHDTLSLSCYKMYMLFFNFMHATCRLQLLP